MPEEGREAPEPEEDEREQATRLVAAAQFASAFDSAPIGMALIDMEGRWLQVNDALCRITGSTRKELKATTLRAITHPDDVDRDADSLRDLLDGRVPSYQTEKRYRHAWGHHLWVLLTVSLVRDDRGKPLHVISQVQDISERKEMAARLEFLLDHDFLTGLYNRRRFERDLAHEVERASRYSSRGAVLMIDLTRRGMTSSRASPGRSSSGCARPTSWRGWGGTSLRRCCRRRIPSKRGSWPRTS